MNADTRRLLDDLLARHGWEAESKPITEGTACRVRVTLETGDSGLLYVLDEARARRLAWCHDVERGAQLFAVPERLESGAGWCLVQDVEGSSIADYLREQGASGLGDLPRTQAMEIVGTIGMVLRKLHNVPTGGMFGDVLEEREDADHQGRFLTFSGFVAAQLEYFAERVRHRKFGDPVVEQLTKSIADMRHELSAFHPRNPASIIHGKLAFEHLWLDPSGREVVGLTGFDHACLVPREADIAYLLWIQGIGEDEGFVRAFYSGYGAARTMDVQRRERFYRRLVAFQSLFGLKDEVPQSTERLIELTNPLSV